MEQYDRTDTGLGKLFLETYNKYPANGFTKFVYRYFHVNITKKPYPIGTWIAILFFAVGTTGMIIFDQFGLKGTATIFAYILLGFGSLIITLPAYWMNQRRIRKIIKELGVTHYLYNYLVGKYIKE